LRLPASETFHRQRERFSLRFTCEECALFDAERELCSHGYPTEEHRQAYYEQRDALIVLCKDFELA
jgi:hypothetical protein